jgi:threonine dehydrogenase-like Zn-dependent dehydrogenase
MSAQASPKNVCAVRPRGSFMRAAVLCEPRRFEIVETRIPEPGDNEVCVRVEGCGICGSNLPVWEGRPWFEYPLEAGAPGHEAWGVVEACGDEVTNIPIGQRVAMLSYHSFGEYDVADAAAVVPLPDDVPKFPGEPTGCAMNIWRRSDVAPEDLVAIIGIGFLGALLTQLAADRGARVIAISRRPFALETARRCGAWKTIEWDDSQQVSEAVAGLSDGELCPRVFECVGNQQALDLATSLAAVRGKLVIAGYHQDGARQVNMQQWNWRGLDVINAHERDLLVYREGMELAVSAAGKGALTLEPLLTHRFDLGDIQLGFEALAQRPDGFLKGWIST